MDNLAVAIGAYGLIVTAAVKLTDALPLLRVGRSPMTKLGLRPPWGKRVTMFVYTFLGAGGAYLSGYITTPMDGFKGWAGVILVSALAVVMSWAAHKSGAEGE